MIPVASAVLGLAVAWWMTVPVHRLKERRPLGRRDLAGERGQDIRAVVGHARCPRCRRDHVAGDVVPVVSWARGCPSCGRRPPATVVGLQAGLPAALGLTAALVDQAGARVAYLWFAVVLAAVSVVDLRILLIPWWLPWLGAAVGAAWMATVALAGGSEGSLAGAALGAVSAFGLLWLVWFAAPGQLGYSDVRLAFTVGLFLGWQSPVLALWGLALGSAVGVVTGRWVAAARRPRHFAFGPSLSAGGLLAVWLAPLLVG
jgi:leader peptidase (prepilin peptidase)/N-methyltransferase